MRDNVQKWMLHLFFSSIKNWFGLAKLMITNAAQWCIHSHLDPTVIVICDRLYPDPQTDKSGQKMLYISLCKESKKIIFDIPVYQDPHQKLAGSALGQDSSSIQVFLKSVHLLKFAALDLIYTFIV